MKVFLFLLLSAISLTNSKAWSQGEVNVYTHRHYDADRALFALFTKETGIEVNVVKADADQLIKRLEIEGEHSPADLLITVDAGRLYRAKEKGLLQPVESKEISTKVPSHLRDPEGHWFGLTLRARVIAYAKDRVRPEELSTYEALGDPKWKERVLVRSSQNIYNQSLLASMVAAHGTKGASAWAEAIVANFARSPKGNDRDQIKALAAGEGDVALVNSYYVGKLLASEDSDEQRAGQAVKLFFPNQGKAERGTHVNISGAGVTGSSKNRANAIRLLAFLVGEKAQRTFAQANYEYPVNPNIEPSPQVKSWGDFRPDTINLGQLGRYNFEAISIFAQAQWR